MDKIKMVDLHGTYLRIRAEIDEAIQHVLNSTAFIQGPEVQQFEEALSKYVDSPFAVTCANGTDALQLALMGLDLNEQDEVIVPVHTYVATAEVIALLGLKPVFTDVDPRLFTIDVGQLESKITPGRTKAIVPVHLYGQCAEMGEILRIAEKHGLKVIEDAAQSLGASYRLDDKVKKKSGAIGHIGTTSFFPSKNLGCFGDGGAIFTSDEELAIRMRMIANHGQRKKYHHDIIGMNSRLDTIQAAVLLVKLKYLNDYTERRRNVANFYSTNIQTVEFIDLPVQNPSSTHVYHQYTLKVKQGLRDRFKQHLEQAGIPTMIYYPVPLHLQKAYRQEGISEGSFPVAEELSKSVISLPIHTEMTTSQLEYIVNAINKFKP